MKALVIGAAGFVGNYLINELKANGYTVYATKLAHEQIISSCDGVYDLDITDSEAVNTLLCEMRPNKIFHLAAQSSVKLSWDNPQLTVKVNILGSLNVLTACKAIKTDSYSPTVMMIGSAEEYGKVTPEECPIKEDRACSPKNIYALTKMTQNRLAEIYSEAYGMDIINVRAFNHTGPMQSPMFVVSDFCSQVAKIEAGIQEPIISVGNLDAMRDFTDVRDIVAAYVRLCESGRSGQTYNVGSGKAVKIADVLDMIISKAKCAIEVRREAARMRPSDVPLHCADTEKIRTETGWSPKISLSQTVDDTLNYFRKLYS
ncbi:MAG: GDP-mannose 4,6-dehydratase [Clostridia bacterium]|nr:GDP-mannose 4,6-dehydratase [Clostridia bacterium]